MFFDLIDMILYSILVLFCTLIIRNILLSRRIKRCEKRLGLLEKENFTKYPALGVCEEKLSQFESKPQTSKHSELNLDSTNISLVNITPPPIPSDQPSFKTETLSKANNEPKPKKNFSIKVPSFIKDNWIGVSGSLACIIGVVFFGITSSFFGQPIVRVGLMLAFSLLLWGFSWKLKQNKELITLSRIFTSVAGVITLFATFGAGEIDGLKFIESPLLALGFLCIGIGVNIYLSFKTSHQMIASLHALFGILAICIPVQTAIFLPLGTIIALIGLCNAYRSRWDIHLILILIAFTLQSLIWTYRMDLTPILHYLALICASFVAIGAAAIHYSKNYQSKEFKALPVIAHLLNWALFAVNIGLHARSTRWTCIFLFAAAIAGFILARTAKKKGISWLFHTDTLIAQFTSLIAIALLSSFSIKAIDIAFLAVVEMLLFIFISNLQKEKKLIQAGYLMQIFVYSATLFFSAEELASSKNPLMIYFHMGIVTVLYWGSYIYFRAKGFIHDTFSCIWFYEEKNESQYSIMALFGTLNFIVICVMGSKLIPIQGIALLGVSALAIWRHIKDDLTSNISFLSTIICLHLYYFFLMLAGDRLGIRIDLVGLALIDCVLIFKNMIQFKNWQRNFHQFFIYMLAIHIGLLTFAYSKTVSALIPTLAYLGFSLAALEIARLSFFKRYGDAVRAEVQTGFLVSGFGYILCYLIGFATVYLQFEALWNNISLRIISEILGILTMAYWIAFKPDINSKVLKHLSNSLIKLLLGFITICIFTESPDIHRPLWWATMTLGLLICTKYFQWPSRLYTYSWIYLIASIFHIALITNRINFPNATFSERWHMHAIVPILLQGVYAYLVHTQNFMNRYQNTDSRWEAFLSRQPSTTVLLPIFLSIAILFAYNFEKALLTLLWVGLTSVYISLGLLVKNKLSIQIGMGALIICTGRLLIFDLVQSNIIIRALVFFCVGILMMVMSVVYKKYKHRIANENI